MTVNHGGRLQPDYFRSYLLLIMSSQDCSINCASDFMLKTFFHGNPKKFGLESYKSFQIAVQSFNKES
ncbi:hypothetical protein [Planococcus sp. YIM B11945]|uniref:hypothetical protein n=1 Tax=Planococcus sp. YIM B11945 TaxID=3435410 RepID=UPI003D7C58E3